jgi:alpha-galactosidase
MNLTKSVVGALLGLLTISGGAVWAAETNYISDLELRVRQDWGDPHRNLSVDGNPLVIGGHKYEHGLGTHATSTMCIRLDGHAELFTADVGVDGSESTDGTVTFSVIGDGKKLFETGIMHGGDGPKPVSVDLHGVNILVLYVGDAGDGVDHDHADWADAKIVMTEGKPVALDPEGQEMIPAAMASANTNVSTVPPIPMVPEAPTPAIHGAKVFGVHPGNPFLFTIAATGDRPMTFSADNLPAGLQVDAQSGQITGVLKAPGEHVVTLRAKNAAGAAERKLKIICGPLLSLTPAMGWNSWNCFGASVTADKIRAAADAMVASGLARHGWTYINIDDYWEQNPRRMERDPTLGGPGRDADGNIVPNPRFPDMKGLVDHIHSLGLKAGIYSSPGPLTCGGCVASWQHEDQDARQYAKWGFDYLKYDWCSYSEVAPADTNTVTTTNGTRRRRNFSQETLEKPYLDMRASLDKVPRDIIFSLCQYGMGDVWNWGADVGGNSWRTSGDITDNWRSLSGNGFRLGGHQKTVNPGHFDDPDMMVLGWVDVGSGRNLHPTRLTHDEQYTHMSLWCLLSSPLLLGCDLTKLDDFTLSLLTNDEVLDVNQDPLARQASRVVNYINNGQVWAKDMEDGSKVVGLFNLSPAAESIIAKWSDLGLSGSQTVRDLWRHQDAGNFTDSFTATVPSHGVVLVKISPAK